MVEHIGNLPGDQPGWWGPVTGFDFCERNYDVTYYVGELWCALTNMMSLPTYFIVAWYVRSKGVNLTSLTYVYLTLAFLDMFSAGMSHWTMRMPWTQAQEKFLDLTYIGFFTIIFYRYHGDRICKGIMLSLAGWRIFEGGLDAAFDTFKTAWRGNDSDIPVRVGEFSLYLNVFGAIAMLIIGRDFTTRGMGVNLSFLTAAFYIFSVTDVYAGNCLEGGPFFTWLHELGHVFGAIADWISMIVLVGLDPEVKKVLEPGLFCNVVPWLFSKKTNGYSWIVNVVPGIFSRKGACARSSDYIQMSSDYIQISA